MSERMWAVDVEGSGSSPPEIVELALVELIDLDPSGRRMHWRFRPRNGISAAATRIHGIRDQDVADAPDFVDVADDILTVLDGARIVGHNVRVEVDILGRGLPGWRPVAAIDTLRLARRLVPDQEKFGLERLGEALGLHEAAAAVTGGTPHSAPYDAVLSALLLARLLRPMSSEDRLAALLDADILGDRQGAML